MYPAPNVSLQPKKKANLKNSNAQIQMHLLAPNVSLLEKKRIPMPTSRAATHTTDMANDGPFGALSLVFESRCKFWSPISCFRWQMKILESHLLFSMADENGKNQYSRCFMASPQSAPVCFRPRDQTRAAADSWWKQI